MKIFVKVLVSIGVSIVALIPLWMLLGALDPQGFGRFMLAVVGWSLFGALQLFLLFIGATCIHAYWCKEH